MLTVWFYCIKMFYHGINYFAIPYRTIRLTSSSFMGVLDLTVGICIPFILRYYYNDVLLVGAGFNIEVLPKVNLWRGALNAAMTVIGLITIERAGRKQSLIGAFFGRL